MVQEAVVWLEIAATVCVSKSAAKSEPEIAFVIERPEDGPVLVLGICLTRNFVTTFGGIVLVSISKPVISIRYSISSSPPRKTFVPSARPIPSFFTLTYTPELRSCWLVTPAPLLGRFSCV